MPLGTVVTVQNLGEKKWLTKPKYCSYSALAHSCTSIIVKILWNLLCQYNNIYTSLHKYLKEKKNTNQLLVKKKTLGTVDINVKMLWTYYFFYLIYKKLRFQQLWKYCDNNKCCNIFLKHLFLVVVGYRLIFYYFILTCKK